MEPSTTNSNEIHHKTLTPPPTIHHDIKHEHEHEHDCVADDHERNDHKPLIVSYEIVPREETTNGSSHQASFLMGNTGSRLEHEPWGRAKLAEEVSGVVIPERWGQEDLLKDWMDCSTFDALLAPKEAGTAREALVAEARPNL